MMSPSPNIGGVSPLSHRDRRPWSRCHVKLLAARLYVSLAVSWTKQMIIMTMTMIRFKYLILPISFFIAWRERTFLIVTACWFEADNSKCHNATLLTNTAEKKNANWPSLVAGSLSKHPDGKPSSYGDASCRSQPQQPDESIDVVTAAPASVIVFHEHLQLHSNALRQQATHLQPLRHWAYSY